MIVKLLIVSLLVFTSMVNAEPRVRPLDWAAPVIGVSLDNMYKVDDGLFRSEQPGKEAFNELALMGIAEVLNLREYHSDEDEATGSNLQLHRIKVDTGLINEEQLTTALDYIQQRQGPLLVHCWHGSDRTGAVIATYRVVVNGWSKEKAIDELVNGGYGYHASIYPNIVEVIQDLNVERVKAALANKLIAPKEKQG